MGTVGTAQAAGYEPTRDRPAPGPYPIFRCRDGHVRVVLLAPRQWHAMRAWLGDPEDLRGSGARDYPRPGARVGAAARGVRAPLLARGASTS